MNLLEVKSLSKNFGGLRAIDYLSFSLAPGEILSLIGSNGAGKTTVFNVITGIYPATEGTVVFDGQPIVETHAHQRDRFLRSFLTGLGSWIPYLPGKLLGMMGMSPILRPHDVVERLERLLEPRARVLGRDEHRNQGSLRPARCGHPRPPLWMPSRAAPHTLRRPTSCTECR